MDHEPTASDYFGAMAAEYDSLIRRAVPVYDEMLERLEVYAPERATRILELGCGSGNLSVRLAARYPDAQLTLVDAAPEMLALAKSRVDAPQRVRTIEARFEELPLEADGYDLVSSCISLHHVVDKASLFRQLRELLEPDGTLLYADQMRGRTERFHAINWDTMEAFWKAPEPLTEAEAQSLREHAQAHDHWTPVVEQVRQLDAAGFRELDVVWRSWMWGIVSARR